MRHIPFVRRALPLAGLVALATLLLAGCGGSSAASSGTYKPVAHGPAQSGAQSGQNGSSSGTANGASGSASSGSSSGQQSGDAAPYLIKSLMIALVVSDPKQAADEVKRWIVGADPKSSSAGAQYSQTADGQTNITLNFTVQAALYSQIEDYLIGYAPQHGGRMQNLTENVQDVSNDVVDTQSRLTNLRTEQQRLLDLMSKAQSLTDVLSIDQRLTAVEGEIEQLEGHLNALKDQTTFYSVSVSLAPLSEAPGPQPGPWNPGQTAHDALFATLAFGEWLVSALIWVAAFAVYLLPVALAYWLVRRRRARRAGGSPVAPPPTPRPDPSGAA